MEKTGTDNVKVCLFGVRIAKELKKYDEATRYLKKAKDAELANPEVIRAECAILEAFPETIKKSDLEILDKVINDPK